MLLFGCVVLVAVIYVLMWFAMFVVCCFWLVFCDIVWVLAMCWWFVGFCCLFCWFVGYRCLCCLFGVTCVWVLVVYPVLLCAVGCLVWRGWLLNCFDCSARWCCWVLIVFNWLCGWFVLYIVDSDVCVVWLLFGCLGFDYGCG